MSATAVNAVARAQKNIFDFVLDTFLNTCFNLFCQMFDRLSERLASEDRVPVPVVD